MKIDRIKISTIFFNYIILMALLMYYVEHIGIWNWCFISLFLLMIIVSNSYKRFALKILGLFIVEAMIIFLSIIVSDNHEYLFTNILAWNVPLLAVFSIAYFVYIDKNHIKKLISSKIIIFNIWWILNLIILLIQVSGNPIFIKSEWISENSFYNDLCCGFFGMNRTHEIAFFACFICCCNITTVIEANTRFIKISLILYTFFTEGVMVYCAILSDNNAFFILLPTFIFTHLLIRNVTRINSFMKSIFKMLIYMFVVIAIIFLILKIPFVYDYINSLLIVKIKDLLFFKSTKISGSNERLAILEYTLSKSSSWILGAGFDSEILGEHSAHGFNHFGLNSIGSTIYLGGIWLYIIHLCIIIKLCMCSIVDKKIFKKYTAIIILGLILIIFTIYSPVFLSLPSMIWIILSFVYI